jgi:opacity protein-like surface antigen
LHSQKLILNKGRYEMTMMKKLTAMAVGALALVAAGSAQAGDNKFFAGPTAGAGFAGGPTMGLNGGYEFSKYGRVEATYDHMFMTSSYNMDVLGMNLVGQIPTGTFVTPYALAGMGYQWQNGINQGMFNVGAGLRMEVTKQFDVDLRYRYIQGLYNQTNNNFVGIGTTFKF